MDLTEQLHSVRRIGAEMGQFSWTSDKYQTDLLDFVLGNRARGAGIIEVGTYKGGLTVQLAVICARLDWPLWSLDISQEFLDLAGGLLRRAGLVDRVRFYLGTLADFAASVRLPGQPLLAILDGDHAYDAVVRDIRSLYGLNQPPYAAAFHNYSLRHPTTGENVERAIKDCFGDWPVRYMGAEIDGASPASFPTREQPFSDGHWWEVPGSEGAIVVLPEKPPALL